MIPSSEPPVSKASITKLVSVMKTETNYTLRKRAISLASNSDDPRIKQALKDLVGRY